MIDAKKDAECGQCLKVKPLLIAVWLSVCYGDFKDYLCADCRMAIDPSDKWAIPYYYLGQPVPSET